jgi:trimethylamine--corrinoid protein Co-methyltransferase
MSDHLDPIRSMRQRQRVSVLDADEVRRVHEAALDILQRTGVGTSSDMLLKLMADHGQSVDFRDKRVRFDPTFVEEKRKLAPRTFTLAGRHPARDTVIDGERTYLSPDGCAPSIIDLETGRRRGTTKADLVAVTRLGDALPQIGFLWRSVSAEDTPVESRALHEVEAVLRNTTKHIQTGSGVDGPSAGGVVELCRAVAGGSDELRQRPILSTNQCIISPLFWDAGPVDAIATYAEAGIPVSIISMALACATAPGTVAGLLALTIAEILSGLAILHTLSPGAKAVCTGYPSSIDMRSGGLNLATGPDDAMAHMACTQVLHALGLPCAAGSQGTGAKRSNWQSGVQSMWSAATNMFLPPDLLSGAGGIYNSTAFSPAQLVLDCEVFDCTIRWAEGYPFDDEHLGIDVVDRVGPGGHYLGQRHTRRHVGEFWRARFMDTSSWEEWEYAGEPDPADAALAEARRILAESQPEPFDEGMSAELTRIVETYERGALDRPR